MTAKMYKKSYLLSLSHTDPITESRYGQANKPGIFNPQILVLLVKLQNIQQPSINISVGHYDFDSWKNLLDSGNIIFQKVGSICNYPFQLVIRHIVWIAIFYYFCYVTDV